MTQYLSSKYDVQSYPADKIMKNILFSFAAGAVLLLAAEQSGAGSLNAGNLDYRIALVGSCTATVTGGTINLGTQVSYAGDIAASTPGAAGTISVTCSSMPYKICVNGGANPATPYRRLKHTVTPTALLNYDLKFSGTVVGDKTCLAAGAPTETADWANPVSASGTGVAQSFPLTANVVVPTNSIPGTYQDPAVAVTIVW